MGNKRTHEDFVAEMHAINPNIEIMETFINCNKRIRCKCKIDGYEWDAMPSELLRGKSCSVCAGKRSIYGYTDITTKAPWMIPYFQGGEDEAKLYTPYSNKKVVPICPDCGRIKDKAIMVSSIYSNHSIGCICSDGVSYPNKYGYSVLNQLPITNIISEYSPDWIKPKRYDFYFEYRDKSYILEMDGGLGHGKQLWDHSNDAVGLLNDMNKDEQAIKHDITVIRIDASKSNSEYIKNSFENNKIFLDLFSDCISNIDWKECDMFAQKNMLKEVCELWETDKYTLDDLAKLKHLSKETIRNYLKKGEFIGFCSYYDKIKFKIPDAQPISCGKYYFSSQNTLIRHSEDLFNYKFTKRLLLKYFADGVSFVDFPIRKITQDQFLLFKENFPELCFDF